MREMPAGILSNDDGSIDYHADRKGQPTKTHQIRRHTGQIHKNKTGQKSERNRKQNHDRGAKFSEKQKKNENYTDTTFADGVNYRSDAGLNQRSAIIKGVESNTLGQRLLNFRNPLFNLIDHYL